MKALAALLLLLPMAVPVLADPVAENVPAPTTSFFVHHIEPHGNTVVATGELTTALAPYAEREMTLDDLKAAQHAVETVYRKHGFILASAYVPPQNVSNGIIKLQIVEGHLGKVIVRGNRHYSDRFLTRQIQIATRDGVFEEGRLQRGLLLLNELPELQVKALLQPGTDPGTSDLVLDVKDTGKLHGQIEYDNFGAQFTGPNRLEFDTLVGNLTNRGDTLAVKTFSSFPGPNGSPTFQFAYSRPVNDDGLKLNLLYSNSDNVLADSLQSLNVNGQTTFAFLGLSQAMKRSLSTSSDVSLTLQSKTFDNVALGSELSHDEIRDLQLAYTSNVMRARSSDTFNFGLSEGLGTFLGGDANGLPTASRAGAGSSFTKVNLDATHFQSFGRTGLLLRFDGQWSSTPLTVGEEFALGGADSVRGFQQSSFLGDVGYSASAEFRVPFNPRPGAPQAAFFLDRGSVRLLNPAVGQAATEDLTGAGPGVRFQLDSHTSARVDLGFPLNGGGLSPVLYTQLVDRF